MIGDLASLFRLRLACLNGVAALGGYGLFPAQIQAISQLAAFSGVTLLAMGGSALNQVLERDLDALMIRTSQRPLPTGRLIATTAVLAGFSAILAGLTLLAMIGGLLPPLLGMTALAWYLAVYTPLKRKTTLALPLGALCGAFPPLIGWCLAGGTPTDYRIITLAGLLFIWQIPHFWLLQERHEDDYRRASIPIAESCGTPASRNMLFWLWLVAFITVAMLLPVFGMIGRPAALWYAAFPVPLVLLATMRSRSFLFTYLNLFPILLTLIFYFRNNA
jgi:protoheme IX farnesyltransferase